MYSILLLHLMARCLETIYVCIWRIFVFIYVVVTVGVCGNVCCVSGVVEDKCCLIYHPHRRPVRI